MADTKVSALTAVTTPAGTDEFPVNQGGTSKKVTNTVLFTNPLFGGYLDITAIAAPSAPGAGVSRFFIKDQAGRPMPAFMGPSGLDTVLQPHMAKNGWAQWRPAGGSTTMSNIGAAALSGTGTATSASYATTSLHTRCSRIDVLVTVAATTAVAGYRSTAANYRTNEGFHFIWRVCPATGVTGVSTKRFFCGMTASTVAPTDVEPSSLVNMVGVGYDAADTNWQVYTNNASGTAAKADTGIARPSADRADVFTVTIFAPPGGGSVYVKFVVESSGASYTSSALSADIPVSTTALAPRVWSSVGGTSSVTGITLFGGYIETDN